MKYIPACKKVTSKQDWILCMLTLETRSIKVVFVLAVITVANEDFSIDLFCIFLAFNLLLASNHYFVRPKSQEMVFALQTSQPSDAH